MASPTSETAPLSPVSDGSFEFVTARGSSDGGFDSDSTLGSNDIVLSPNVAYATLSLASGEASDSVLVTSDGEDNDLVLVERGQAISPSVSARSRATSVSEHALHSSSPSTTHSAPLAASVQETVRSTAHASFPVLIEEEDSRAATPAQDSRTLPALEVALPIQDTTAASPKPIDQWVAYPLNIPEILLAKDFKDKEDVLSILGRLKSQVDAIDKEILKTSPAEVLSPPSTPHSLSHPTTSLKSLQQRRGQLQMNFDDHVTQAILKCGVPVLIHSSTVVDPFTPYALSIPDVLKTEEHAAQYPTLDRLERMMKKMRQAEQDILAAKSAHEGSETRSPALQRLILEKERLAKQMERYVACALLKVEASPPAASSKAAEQHHSSSLTATVVPSDGSQDHARNASSVFPAANSPPGAPAPVESGTMFSAISPFDHDDTLVAEIRNSRSSERAYGPPADVVNVPEALKTRTYKKKARTLKILARFADELRAVVEQVDAAARVTSWDSKSKLPPPPGYVKAKHVKGMLNTKVHILGQAQECVDAALLRVANRAIPQTSHGLSLDGTTKNERKRERKRLAAEAVGLPSKSSAPPPLPDVLDEDAITLREDAVAHMNRYLDSPPAQQTPEDHLITAQYLLVELGIVSATDALPTSISAAHELFWTYVHLNVQDYLDVRSRGIVALREVMHPSKSALRKDLRQRERKMPLQTIRDLGLGDLIAERFLPL